MKNIEQNGSYLFKSNQMLDPFFTALEAWVIFSESLSPLNWLALGISLFGIYLALSSQSIHRPT